LNGVSCTSVNVCFAVGLSLAANHVETGLAERWNGQKWRILPISKPRHRNSSQLWGVSCSSATACTAVGAAYKSSGGTFNPDTTVPLAERWNGSDWTIQTTPYPRGSAPWLSAVSCPSVRICDAFGPTNNSQTVEVLAERWVDNKWRSQPTPNPSSNVGTFDGLFGLSCASPHACTAAGSSSERKTLAEQWTG
jgi:hypothetical protein